MLTASILKIFYWFGARFDLSLLVQAIVMIFVQVLLLKVALDNRPSLRRDSETLGVPFKGLGIGERSSNGGVHGELHSMPTSFIAGIRRPYRFWRWRKQRPYWEYLGGLTLTLLALQTYFRPGLTSPYTTFVGYTGLAVEATLPIPQLLANYRARSCKGFRVSVLANWLFGDAMKMGFFFLSEPGKVPWAFKMCGIFQAACDAGLGAQYWIFGDGEGDGVHQRGKEDWPKSRGEELYHSESEAY